MDFLKKENVQLLWEVISEDDVMKDHDSSIKNEIYKLFINNIQGFYDSNKIQSKPLIDTNKTYIRLIIGYIKKNHTVVIKSSSRFEDDLTKKQNEFTSAMTKPVPPVPKFSDKLDEPISEMALAIKQAQEQRNYDTEQVKKSYSTNNSTEWLKSQGTSLQNEKLTKKYIKINNNEEKNINNDDIIDLNPTTTKKHISWPDDLPNVKMLLTEIIPDEEERNDDLKGIFKKLKQVTIDEDQKSLAEKVEYLINKVNLILQILNLEK
jgi:hypothetical protein